MRHQYPTSGRRVIPYEVDPHCLFERQYSIKLKPQKLLYPKRGVLHSTGIAESLSCVWFFPSWARNTKLC